MAGADPVLSVVERPLDQPEEFDRLTLDTRYRVCLHDRLNFMGSMKHGLLLRQGISAAVVSHNPWPTCEERSSELHFVYGNT